MCGTIEDINVASESKVAPKCPKVLGRLITGWPDWVPLFWEEWAGVMTNY